MNEVFTQRSPGSECQIRVRKISMYRYYFEILEYWYAEMREKMCERCLDIQRHGEGMGENGSDDTTIGIRLTVTLPSRKNGPMVQNTKANDYKKNTELCNICVLIL